MGAQGYYIKQNISFQDDQSAKNKEKIGTKSCTENSRHINICYLFAKDRLKQKKSIAYCST